MAIGIGIGLPFRRNLALAPAVPTGLLASFTVDTISGDLTWTDNSAGKAQYEIYSSTNGGDYALLTTTSGGATSYSDTTCKQNASVVYRVRAKKGLLYSDYATTPAINTPLCFKTDQSVLTQVWFFRLYLSSGSLTVNWGDGTSNIYSGNNDDITKNYSSTGQFNITLSGNINNITYLNHSGQSKSYGDLTNWILPLNLKDFYFSNNSFTGDLTNWEFKNNFNVITIYGNNFTGKLPNVLLGATLYNSYSNSFSGSNLVTFKINSTSYNLSNQKVTFPTSEVNKFFKTAADWYQNNAPTANCIFNLSGANMGIPTDGASNVDIVRLIGYYLAAGFAATIICRTS